MPKNRLNIVKTAGKIMREYLSTPPATLRIRSSKDMMRCREAYLSICFLLLRLIIKFNLVNSLSSMSGASPDVVRGSSGMESGF
uniref:Uncharacterized protein n=1 Tax=Romanomermis culicivorax TaxID=13658 RepID=A0A915JGA3_ROMCU